MLEGALQTILFSLSTCSVWQACFPALQGMRSPVLHPLYRRCSLNALSQAPGASLSLSTSCLCSLLAPAVHGGDLEGCGNGHDAGAVPQRIRGDQQAPR